MIDAFSTALGTALTAFVTDVSGAIGDNVATVIPIGLGVVGIFLIWRVVKRLASGR
jgi:hypothetical protein